MHQYDIIGNLVSYKTGLRKIQEKEGTKQRPGCRFSNTNNTLLLHSVTRAPNNTTQKND